MTTANEWHLPTHVRPTAYRLTLAPDLETFTFEGSQEVSIEVTRPTTDVVLNCVEIDIRFASIVMPDGSRRQAEAIVLDEETETATITFAEELQAGPTELSMEFSGELNDKLRGFYRSSYTDVDGNQRWMATTQFESTDARRAFPCWDEPAIKAMFEVTLIVPDDLVTISNTEPASTVDNDDGTKTVRFAETPVMSTYLLAFIVGDLACVQDRP